MSLRLPFLFLLVFAACGVRIPPAPIDAFMRGDLDPVRAYYDKQVREGDVATAAMFLNGLANIELLDGQIEAARRHFRAAGRVMGNWSTSSGEAFAAIVGSESSKTWKGDPHEKVMNAFYTGLCYLWKGELDNARASFKAGIRADAESDEGDAQIDFALIYWLAGRMTRAQGMDDTEDFFKHAREARKFAVAHGAAGPSKNPLLETPASGNLVCLIDIGLGPQKVAGGKHRELAEIRKRKSAASRAEVFIDGKSVGQSWLMADLDYQASTRGGEAMAGIRKGKAVFKTAADISGVVLINEGLKDNSSHSDEKLAVGLGLLALSLLTRSEADTRQWEILPKHVHALTVDVESGEHELRIEFLRAGGGRLPGLTQNWTIEVPETGEAYYYFRSLPGLDRRHAKHETE